MSVTNLQKLTVTRVAKHSKGNCSVQKTKEFNRLSTSVELSIKHGVVEISNNAALKKFVLSFVR